MLQSNLELVKHINDECEFILKYTGSLNYDSFYEDKVLLKAIERCLEIIGEAAKKMDEEFVSNHPEIEWRQMAATRNIIIHNYTGVDYELVWEIVKENIPELEFQIKKIIKQNE